MATAGALVALGLVLIGAPTALGAPRAATTGCQSVDGGEVSTGGGPDRATVVVDTGSGAVWSACISFSGSISGIEALERAQSVITDLDPVYDQYSGLGKAVCKLRGVGSDPPDCLGKSVDYWSYSHDGKVAPVGAGSVTLEDGDVDGWRYGTGGLPRAATEGTRATSASPVTTTRPPTGTTSPSATPTTPGGGGLTGSTTPDGDPVATTAPNPGGSSTTTPGSTTSVPGGTSTTAAGEVLTADTELAAEPSGDAAAAAASTGSSSGAAPDGGSGGGSSLPAAAGFVAVLAVIGGGAVLVRRRRLVVDADLTPSAS